MKTASSTGTSTPANSVTSLWQKDQRFFTLIASVLFFLVFIGFSRSFYLRPVFHAEGLSPLLMFHGIIFSLWMVLFVVQVRLVATNRVSVHKKLGIFGIVLMAAMVVIGISATIDSAKRGFTPNPDMDALTFMFLPIGDMLFFPTFVIMGIYFRKRPDLHKRLMLLSSISIMSPAIDRLPLIGGHGPGPILGILLLLILWCNVYNKRVHGKLHPAFLYGGVFILLSHPLRILIGQTDAWHRFAVWLTGL